MRINRHVLFAAVGLTISVLCFAGTLCAQTPAEHERPLALLGGVIYTSPTEDALADGVILIQEDRIVAVGKSPALNILEGAEILDCARMTVVAGFWNSHVHFFERKWANAATIPAPELGRQLQEMLTRYGFTSVFDIGSRWANTQQLRDRIESGEVPGPRIHSTGEALVAPGAVPPESILNLMGIMAFPAPEIMDAGQALAATRRLLDAGVDGIKLHLQTPLPPHQPLPESAIAAAASEAHRLGKPVFVHPNSRADILAAVRAGVDVVAHTTPRTGSWDEAILLAMKEQRVAIVPTLSLWNYFMRHDRSSIQEQLTEAAVGQLRAWLAAGGTVLFGTDAGAADNNPSEEYALMAEAGMSFRDILASLTTLPAERFGEAQRLGRIAPGFTADLVVLGGDPSTNVLAFGAVRYTIRDGKLIYQASK